jgi:hypothetical protein
MLSQKKAEHADLVTRRPHPRRHRRRHRKQTPAARGGDDSVCYFHNTFGDKAKKCKPGCSWSGNGSAAGN